MDTIKIKKSDLDYAVNACDVNGSWHLMKDGSTEWVSAQQSAPDESICKIPVFDPDGSGALHDACSDKLTEIFGESPLFWEEKIDGESPSAYLEDNHPEEYAAIVDWLKENAIDKLKLELESGIEMYSDEYTQEVNCYALEIIE